MKMSLLLSIALFFLLAVSGCVPLVKQFVPSLEYCDEVTYYRKGSQFQVMANCRL